MPAPYAPPPGPPTPPGAEPDRIPVLYLRGGNGDTITFNGWADGYAAGKKSSGIFGIDPRDVRRRANAGAGSRWAGTRRVERPIEFVARVVSPTVAVQRARLDRLADILDDVTYGPAVLGVLPPEGGAGAAREIPVHYTAGFEGVTSDDVTTTFERLPLSLLAMRPVWRAVTPQTAGPWEVDSEKPFLSDDPDDEFFDVVLGTGRVLGAVELNNPGNVASPARWTVAGGGGAVTIQDGAGEGFVITSTRADGDVRVVDTEQGTVVDGDGVNVYDELADAPKLWQIPPGWSTAMVDITDAAPGSSVVLEYWPQFKRAW